MELAHSVIVELKREGRKIPFLLSYDGTSEDKFLAVKIDPLLPDNVTKQFWDIYRDWDKKTAGLFVDRESLLGFVIIVKTVFEDKYETKYKWIGGANPYEAWKKAQEEAPEGIVY